MNRLLDRLEALGALQPVDVALGRLLAEKSEHEGACLGLIAALTSAALAHGHSCLPLENVPTLVASLLPAGVDAETILAALPGAAEMRSALLSCDLVNRDGGAAVALVFDHAERLYLRRYFRYEQDVAAALRKRMTTPIDALADTVTLRSAVARWFGDEPSGEQAIAALLAVRSRFVVISGGPGTGKTTTVLRLLALLADLNAQAKAAPLRIALTAPTGKAAARLSESLRSHGLPIEASVLSQLPPAATTVHRLLGAQPGQLRTRYDREHPLPYDLVVVDEASMLDLALAAKLCNALAPQTRLLLLGDRDQLASVEAGSVFAAICMAAAQARHDAESQPWLATIVQNNAQAESSSTLVELRRSHRFDSSSAIGEFARAVRDGDSRQAQSVLDGSAQDISAQAVGEKTLAAAIATFVIPRYLDLLTATSPEAALDIAERFRVLCALRDGPFGAGNLNTAIERELRRHASNANDDGWFSGRLVLIGSNDYRQGLFNGDIGVALATGAHGALQIWFRLADGNLRAFAPALLPAHAGAFALTVHKAQGSEFDETLVVLPSHDARVLGRELLYTAVTRARRKVDLWTSPEILATTIARSTQRWSGLADALLR